MIDTSKVKDRRAVRYATIQELLTDIDRIVASEKAGTLRRAGNWTAGQAFGHLATWINYAWEGYPIRPPWFVRLFIRLKKKSYLRDGMPAGVRIPGVEGGTKGTETLSLDEGTARLRKALQRLESGEPATFDSPAWGKSSHAEQVQITLRHAELHLSFLHP